MNNKILVSVLVLIVAIVGGYFLLKGGEVQAPVDEIPVSGMPVPGSETPEMVVTPATENIITYTDAGYSPSALTVKVGDTVVFKNESADNMWPASAMHPTHAVYPTTGGCFGSTFDACRGVLPGDSWSFKFDIAGTWKYHDHLKPSVFGTIVVE